MALENKRLKSKVESVEKEVRQLIEGMESDQGQGSSEEKNEMCLQGMLTNRTMLGVKRMGELNSKPFSDACALKFSEEAWEIKSAEICSLWEEYLKDSNWYPFKHIIIDGKQQEVIDKCDERLGKLRLEWGEEAYEAVRDALLELNEYNPSGRYPVREIWNFKEERKASLKEVIECMIQLVKTSKRKR